MNALNYAFWNASEAGNIDKVRSLIERGADVHSRDREGLTALHHASRQGDAAVASLLIDRGAKVDSRDYDGKTALHSACFCNECIDFGYCDYNAKAYGDCMHNDAYMYDDDDDGDDDDDDEDEYHVYKETAILLIRSKANIYIRDYFDEETPLDQQLKWRVELTQLYEEVNRDWLARKSFLFVLIGCNYIKSESNKHNASKQTQNERVRERENVSEEFQAKRDEVMRTQYRSIAQYL